MPSEKDPNTRQAPHTFRSFGDPPNLCPGRHFGSTEVMAILATMLMRYDIAPESGGWKMPENELVVFAAIMPPKRDIKVKVTPRQGWQGDWIFRLGDPSARPPLLCGWSWSLGTIANEGTTKKLLGCSWVVLVKVFREMHKALLGSITHNPRWPTLIL